MADRIMTRHTPDPPQVSPSSFTVEAERADEQLVARLAGEWRELCEQSPNDQPFYRPEWIGAYLRAFEPRAKLLVVAVRLGGRLKAILPLIEEWGYFCGLPARKLRAPVNAHPGRFDLVRSADPAGDAAIPVVWNALKQFPGWDILELSYVPESGSAEQLFSLAQMDGYRTAAIEMIRAPYITLSGATAEGGWLEGTSAHFRQNLRRRTRKLTSRAPLRLRRIEKAEPELLQRFYAIEARGWKGREGSAVALSQETRQFYDEIAREAERFGYFCLHLLDLGERTLAGSLSLVYGGRYFPLKWAYDEEFHDCGPGHILINAILEECARRRLNEFDFLGASAEYKAQWTPQARPHRRLVVFRETLCGRTLHAIQFRIKPSVRRLLRACTHAWRVGMAPTTEEGCRPSLMRERDWPEKFRFKACDSLGFRKSLVAFTAAWSTAVRPG